MTELGEFLRLSMDARWHAYRLAGLVPRPEEGQREPSTQLSCS
ncbi:hypothetical protein [Kribbella sp. VKM Ac-2568]|nr:hypothetical protein [Kribbella sp. VKM Ac-2568]